MLQTKRSLVFAVFLLSLFTSSCEGKAYGNETCPENELSIYLNSYEETMTELLSVFQLNFLQGSVAKRPETIIAMLSIYVDFEYVPTPECALDHHKQTLDAMNGLIDVATDIGDTNFSKLSIEHNKKIIDALDMIILVNENANELWKLVDAGVMREDSVVTAVDSISTTITTLVRPTPTALETIAGTPSTVTGLTIGEISYRLPSAKSGWCLVDTFSEEDRESHSLRSNCQSTTDPRSSIEIIHLLTDQKSTQNAINSYVQTLKDFGFAIDYFQFMEKPFNSSVGPVEIAMLDITDKQTNNTAYLVLGSFIVSEKYYIIRGLHDGTQEGLDFLVDSMFSILDSMEITN